MLFSPADQIFLKITDRSVVTVIAFLFYIQMKKDIMLNNISSELISLPCMVFFQLPKFEKELH